MFTNEIRNNHANRTTYTCQTMYQHISLLQSVDNEVNCLVEISTQVATLGVNCWHILIVWDYTSWMAELMSLRACEHSPNLESSQSGDVLCRFNVTDVQRANFLVALYDAINVFRVGARHLH